MAQRNIDFGAFPDDPDADAIRSAFEKVQLNFTEVFAGLGDQAVVSVNRTAGPGIYLVNGSPVGNVVLGANISCVQVSSSTLQITRDAPGNGSAGGSATITDATQTLYVDLPTSLANLTDISISGNLVASNITANANITTANLTVTTAATMTVPLTVTSLTATGNITGNNLSVTSGNVTGGNAIFGNVYANSGRVQGATLGGTLVTAAQPNITSLGTLTSLAVTATTTTGNLYANAGIVQGQYLKGDGSNISALTGANVTGQVGFAAVANSVAGGNVSGAVAFATTANAVAGANVSGQVANALVAGTVYTNAQPNITSVGTLTSVNVTGNANVGNIGGTGGIFTYVTGDGANLSSLTGANVTGQVGFAGTANAVAGSNVSGAVSFATTANSVAGANVSGAVSFATTANSVAGANVSGEVNFAATANAVAGANVFGEVSFADTANSVAGANVSGEVAFAATANAVAGANVAGAVANATHAVSSDSATTAGTVTTNAQPNITSVGTLSSLDVTGNLSAGNVLGGNLVSANFIQGDGSLLTNISVGAGSYIENGTSNVVVDLDGSIRTSVSGNANIFRISGTGANVTGTFNVTGIATLNSIAQLIVNGESNLGPVSNVTITGGANNAFLMTDGAGNLTWDTATLVPAQGSNTQVIFNDGGSTYAGSANLTFDKTSNTLSATKIAGTITTAAQPNITSVGALTSLILYGNLNSNASIITNAGNIEISGGSGVYKGNGSGLTALAGSNVTGAVAFATTANSVAGANVSGTVANATFATSAGTAGTVTTNAQPNITSVGTLTSLSVTGNANAGNVGATNFVGSGASLTALNGSNITTGTIAAARVATLNQNTTGYAATVSTNAQPNITSVGTLTSLSVTGNANVGNIGATNGVFTSVSGNGSALTALNASNISTGTLAQARLANSTLTLGSTTLTLGATTTTVAGLSSVTSTTFVGALTGAATTAGTVTTAAQPNITSVGTLTGLTIAANGDITMSGTGSNINGVALVSATLFAGSGANLTNINGSNISSGTIAAARVATLNQNTTGYAATVSTNAQPNITSTGTLTSLGVSGNITAANITANTGIFAGNGSGLSALNGSNITTGTVAAARVATLNQNTTGYAATVSTAAQPNITSVGTLTSLTSSGNISGANIVATSYHIRSVGTSISAAGTVQANATALTKEINVVSTVASGAGVRLPTAVAGMVLNIVNTSANPLKVYPASGGIINTLATNGAFTQPAGATLQFISTSTTQWYSVGATYA